MALELYDRIQDTTTTTGLSDLTLSGTAITGYRTFGSVLANNDTCYYFIDHFDAGEWECGIGTSDGSTGLARTTILSSSTGSKVSLSAGTKAVYIDIPASKSVFLDANDDATFPADIIITNNVYLPSTNSSATIGVVYVNGTRFIHSYEPLGTDTNTFIGKNAGSLAIVNSTSTEGLYNVGIGYNVLNDLTYGQSNLCIGTSSGADITTGSQNVFMGFASGFKTNTGSNNIGLGPYSMDLNQDGDNNIGIGNRALYTNVSNDYNVAIGYYALNVAVGTQNVAIGGNAGRSISTGADGNIFIGYNAGYDGSQSTSADYTICIGYSTYTSGNQAIAIGYNISAGANETVIGGTATTRTSLQGALCIDDCAIPTGTATSVIALPDNAGTPTPATNTACLYATDDAGTTSMYFINEGGSGQKMTPHNNKTGEWEFYGFNIYTGKHQRVNMEKLVRKIEELTGESFLEEWFEPPIERPTT